MLSLQRPYPLHCNFGSGLFSVPLELSGRKGSGLRYAAKTNYRTKNYQLAHLVLENRLAAPQVTLHEIQVDLFESQQQHIMQLYCSKHLYNAFRFFCKAMGLAYAEPPLSLLAKVLTKIAYEGATVVICTPDWGCSGGHAYWRRMLDQIVIRTYLSIYFLTLIYWISATSAPVSSIAQHCNEIRKLVVSRRSALIT